MDLTPPGDKRVGFFNSRVGGIPGGGDPGSGVKKRSPKKEFPSFFIDLPAFDWTRRGPVGIPPAGLGGVRPDTPTPTGGNSPNLKRAIPQPTILPSGRSGTLSGHENPRRRRPWPLTQWKSPYANCGLGVKASRAPFRLPEKNPEAFCLRFLV